MRNLKKLMLLLFAAGAVPALFSTGCTVHAGYYDPYYHDQHQWGVEGPYYGRWESETHRQHEEFKQRKKEEQKEYWDWRHRHQ